MAGAALALGLGVSAAQAQDTIKVGGGIEYRTLRMAYHDMLDRLSGSRCHTKILEVGEQDGLFHAFVCRLFHSPSDELVEEQCHLIYLRDREGELQIVGQPASARRGS